MIIQWHTDVPVDYSLLALMQVVADASMVCASIEKKVAVNIVLCDDEKIQEINRAYRSIDRSTDVLSFPLIEYPHQAVLSEVPGLLRTVYDDDIDAAVLGDIIISMPHVLAQAEEYGHTVEREAAYLTVHGICHLMGYDHMEEEEKKTMRAMEEKILCSVGLGREATDMINDDMLLELAKAAMERSYSPYSGFRVGAALLAADGRVFQGCNIENASLGATNCAERTALFKAVSEGAREFTTIAIAAESSAPWPCGICRQALNEFAPDLRVLVTWDGQVEESTLPELLPNGFGPHELAQGKKRNPK